MSEGLEVSLFDHLPPPPEALGGWGESPREPASLVGPGSRRTGGNCFGGARLPTNRRQLLWWGEAPDEPGPGGHRESLRLAWTLALPTRPATVGRSCRSAQVWGGAATPPYQPPRRRRLGWDRRPLRGKPKRRGAALPAAVQKPGPPPVHAGLLSVPAPTARNPSAQGNALGTTPPMNCSALKGPNNVTLQATG